MVRPGFSDLEDSAFIPGGARWGRGGVQGPDEEPGEEGCPPRAGWSGETQDKVGVRWELLAVQTGAEGGGLEDNWGRVPGEGRAAAEVLR